MHQAVRRVLRGLAMAALPACGLATSGLGTTGSGSSGGSAGAGTGAGTGDQDAGAHDAGEHDAGDGGMPVGDSIPPSAVTFFQGTACPMGWASYTAADGRFLVPTVATSPGGLAHGTPLASGEDRTHTHNFTATFMIGSTCYLGAAGGGNAGVGTAGPLTLTRTSDPASTGLPYVQLLVCRKDAPAVPGSAPLPHGMQMFFDMAACPVGWAQATATQGRLIVGLPQGAPQDLTFGGPALSSGDAGADSRTHAHDNTVTLTTTPHGIALLGGCGAGGYAANGTYTASAPTTESDTGLPYLELLQCEKQ